jgi:hypothetical protein
MTNYRRLVRHTAFLLLLVLSSATLPHFAQTAPASSSNESVETQWMRYNATVIDSATWREENLRPLFPLRFEPETMTTTVVTLTSRDYTPGPQSLGGYVWVTAVPEVQQKCKDFKEKDLALRLRQLLGLQPEAQFQHFVVMKVAASDIFRPATNPLTTTPWPCGAKKESYCGEQFPYWASPAHMQWLANQMLTSYVVAPEHNGTYSYPWTRLGYTYDWKEGADRYGASEYVVRPGSVVNVLSVTPYAAYCGRE